MKFEDIEIEEVDFEAMLEDVFRKSNSRALVDINSSVKYVLCYYLAEFLERRDIPKYFKGIDSNDYIDQITEYVEKLNINTIYSKKFLEDNNKYELLSIFNRR